MTEIVARLPRPLADRLLLPAVVAAAVLAAALLVLLGRVAADDAVSHPRPTARAHARPQEPPPAPAPRVVPPRWTPSLEAALASDAARGFAHDLFAYGAADAATRVARWRPLIQRATRGSGFSPTLLEGLVLLESSGRSDAMAGSDPAAAAGLTQLTVARAHALHVRVDLRASRRLTFQIRRAELHGRHRRAQLLEARRRGVDRRFLAATSLRATVAYLEQTRRVLGSRDLAVAAYHIGLRALRNVVAGRRLSYARLYFGSAPDRHPRVWHKLHGLGGDYYWRVLAAKRIMRLYSSDYDVLAYEARQQARKSSAEEVLHPSWLTPQFRSPRALARAWRRHYVRAIPLDARRTHVAIGPSFGEMARRLGRSPRLYRALRPSAREVLLFMGRRVHHLSGARQPLILTSAVRDRRYQALLMRVNPNAARTYSVHTTGYAFDVARTYGSARQAAAFEFVLERLKALGVIAFIREGAAIHIAVASHVSPALLRRAA